MPDRAVAALCDAARGWRVRRVRRSLYIKLVAGATGEAMTEATATRDLQARVAAGLLHDPYVTLLQPTLPGLGR